MQFIIPVVVIALMVLSIVWRIKKQQKLLDEAKKYETLLKDSRLIRWNFLQSTERCRDILKDYESIAANLTALKAELLSIRADIRDELRFIRAEEKQSTGSDLDKRTIIQLKTTLEGKWKHFSSRKTAYNDKREMLHETEKKMDEAKYQENQAGVKWEQQKEKVINLWRELKPKVKVTDPNKYFS